MATAPLQRYVETRDAEAFREIVSAYQDLVYGTCRRILGNRAEVEDAVQETFIKLARKAGEIHSNLGAWLHACARGKALDALKARKARGQENVVPPEAEDVVSRRDDGQFNDNALIVDSCLGELSELDREVVVSYFFVEQTQEEIANRIGVSRVAIKKRIDRALEALRLKFLRRGLAVSGLMMAFLSQIGAEAKAPAQLRELLSRIDPLTAQEVARSAPLIAAGAGKTWIVKMAAAVLATAILTAGISWLATRKHEPFRRTWDFHAGPLAEVEVARGSWQWQAASGNVPAMMRPTPPESPIVEVFLPRELPATPLVLSFKARLFPKSEVDLGWMSQENMPVPSRWAMPGPDQSGSAHLPVSGSEATSVMYLVGDYALLVQGEKLLLIYQCDGARSHRPFLVFTDIGIEAMEMHEAGDGEIPAQFLDPGKIIRDQHLVIGVNRLAMHASP